MLSHRGLLDLVSGKRTYLQQILTRAANDTDWRNMVSVHHIDIGKPGMLCMIATRGSPP